MTDGKSGVVNYSLVKFHIGFSMLYLGIVMLGGLLYSLQFIGLYPFSGIEFLSPGRIRMLHTNGAVYGFIINGFITSPFSSKLKTPLAPE